MLNLIALKEMKHQYGEKELFQMMVRRARGAQEALDNVGAEEAREFITSPQPEIFSSCSLVSPQPRSPRWTSRSPSALIIRAVFSPRRRPRRTS